MSLILPPNKSICEEPHQIVAEVVERALVLGVVGAGQAVTHDHVGLAPGHGGDHLGRGLRGVGVVAVHKNVRLCVDLAGHAAHDIALALLVLMADNGPGSTAASSAVPSVESLS